MMVFTKKVGFIGAGNMAQSIIKGLTTSQTLSSKNIFATNRTERKLQKLQELYDIQALQNNEQLIEECNVVILCMKPQDLFTAIEPIASSFHEDQIIVSLAAGISIAQLRAVLPEGRLVRIMPNTPIFVNRGVIGYALEGEDIGLETTIQDLFNPLGYVIKLSEGEEFDALLVSCGSGTGFVFELMQYWQEWIEEYGIDAATARKMTVETFFGAAQLASSEGETSISELQAKVTSKKGVTAAGLDSMRELEIERLLRYSFEKASLRNQELGQ